MGVLKELIKKIWLCMSLTYRHTTYLLRHAESVDAAIQLAQKTDDELNRRIVTLQENVVTSREQLNAVIRESNTAMQERLDTAVRENNAELRKQILNLENTIQKAHTALAKAAQGNKEQVRELSAKMTEYLRPQNERFTGHYEYWRAKRVTTIVEHYGESWFKGKSILELGCGYGDIGYVLMTLGAQVTFAEGRAENCDYLRRKFPNNKVYFMNCENEWPFAVDSHFDMVLHMGLLYHLDNMWFVLDRACTCSDHVVLETEVSDSEDENYILKIQENTEGWDQSLMGRGSRPSGPCVEKHLRELGWKYQRVTDARCNAQFHVYDWEVTNTGTWRNGLRRFWFCEKGESEEPC